MLEDFKKFLMRGNVVDLAVGVIIGAAFGKIVGSLVDDVIMPVLGLALGLRLNRGTCGQSQSGHEDSELADHRDELLRMGFDHEASRRV